MTNSVSLTPRLPLTPFNWSAHFFFFAHKTSFIYGVILLLLVWLSFLFDEIANCYWYFQTLLFQMYVTVLWSFFGLPLRYIKFHCRISYEFYSRGLLNKFFTITQAEWASIPMNFCLVIWFFFWVFNDYFKTILNKILLFYIDFLSLNKITSFEWSRNNW